MAELEREGERGAGSVSRGSGAGRRISAGIRRCRSPREEADAGSLPGTAVGRGEKKREDSTVYPRALFKYVVRGGQTQESEQTGWGPAVFAPAELGWLGISPLAVRQRRGGEQMMDVQAGNHNVNYLKISIISRKSPLWSGESQFLSGINTQSCWRLLSYSCTSEPPWSRSGFDPTLKTTSSQLHQWIFHLQLHIPAGQHSSSSRSYPPHSWRLKYSLPPPPSVSVRSSNINSGTWDCFQHQCCWKIWVGLTLFHQLKTENRDSSAVRHMDYNAYIHQIYLYMYVYISHRHNFSFTAVQSSNKYYLYLGPKQNFKNTKRFPKTT